jgi:hypothetical protein
MQIDKVTITGADDRTNYNDLLNLQEDFPFVEWGILFSESKEGKNRYPSTEHRNKQFIGGLNLSAHFCGWWARQVLEECNYRLIDDLPPQYKRIQLNYNFNTSTKFNLKKLREYMDGVGDRIILQYNRSNKPALDIWLREHSVSSKFHFLYDASGGRGTEIDRIEQPIGGHYTGYAGGLSIDNLDKICCDIRRVKSDTKVWVDLESGARTGDKFDLELVRRLLHNFEFHVKQNHTWQE